MEPEPITVMLQLVPEPGPFGGCLATIGWHGWMKAAGAFNGLPRELRNTMTLI
jgi:hypothetical protein